MYFLLDISVMRTATFDSLVKHFPTATKIYVFLCCQWAPIMNLPIPSTVEVQFANCHYSDASEYFEELVEKASLPGASDQLFVLDQSFSDGKLLYKRYINGAKNSADSEKITDD